MNTTTRAADYLSYEHAAAKLDLTVNALRLRVSRGTIPAWCYTRQLGSIRFIASALDELMQPADRAAVLRELHAPTVSRDRAFRTRKTLALRAVR